MQREKLQRFRKSRGMTQENMAVCLGVSLSHYKGIERGTQNPSISILQRFYEKFKDDCGDILGLFVTK